MEINWKIIAIVAFIAIILVAYLIYKNQIDKEKVTKYFNTDTSELTEEEDELNNLK
jgi:cell division protein FtsW (lipid II flippase)